MTGRKEKIKSDVVDAKDFGVGKRFFARSIRINRTKKEDQEQGWG